MVADADAASGTLPRRASSPLLAPDALMPEDWALPAPYLALLLLSPEYML